MASISRPKMPSKLCAWVKIHGMKHGPGCSASQRNSKNMAKELEKWSASGVSSTFSHVCCQFLVRPISIFGHWFSISGQMAEVNLLPRAQIMNLSYLVHNPFKGWLNHRPNAPLPSTKSMTLAVHPCQPDKILVNVDHRGAVANALNNTATSLHSFPHSLERVVSCNSCRRKFDSNS